VPARAGLELARIAAGAGTPRESEAPPLPWIYAGQPRAGPPSNNVAFVKPWTGAETSASCQVFELRVWAALTEQSRGSLHAFLPLTDRGVDAIVHRLTDDQYVLVQAKDRSTLTDGEVHLVVWADSLADDRVVIVGGLLVDGGLGPMSLVIPAGDFKRLASRSIHEGKQIYQAEFGMRPRSDSRWLPWLVPTERLATRFVVSI